MKGAFVTVDEFLADATFSPAERAERADRVRARLLADSRCIGGGDFDEIATSDLDRLFVAYDAVFFGGRLRELLDADACAILRFRLAPRMTSAGGKTFVRRRSARVDGAVREIRGYEIAISTTLLFQTFRDVERTVTVVGLVCSDRLDALQRIFEHELVHLVELLVTGRSGGHTGVFRTIAEQVFGHREFTHRLVTQHERAFVKHAIRVGDSVEFDLDGQRLEGFVNRITRRATVLVESPDGQPYSDGRCYRKYYVPLGQLRRR